MAFAGRVETPTIESAVLASNRLDDPTAREVPVYLPPGWDAPGASFPVVYLLAGFTGRGQKFLETHPWHKGVALRYDELVAAGTAPPAILVMPDCFTRMGGSQYVNSSYMGRYEDHLVRELVPFVDQHYPTRPGRRGVMGKSSGGYGAMRLSMRHSEVFGAAASISGDCHFEYGYAPEFLAGLRGLESAGGDPAAFLRAFFEDPKLDGDGHAVINLLAMSACYSPNPDSPLGFDLPVELGTGRRVEEVWKRWLAFDPVTLIDRHASDWRDLDWLHLECGKRDEFHLQFGLRILRERLVALDVPHEYEEFDGGHFGIDDRYLALLPRMIAALRD
ncbi:MAG: esterase [Planctomycetes bacterium]|nr:esterase [Planctomycetota bacterium]